jgi:hypothetical protein
MEELRSSQKSVTFYKFTGRNIPEDSNPRQQFSENFASFHGCGVPSHVTGYLIRKPFCIIILN